MCIRDSVFAGVFRLSTQHYWFIDNASTPDRDTMDSSCHYSSENPTSLCDPSQNGIARDAPHRHRANLLWVAPSKNEAPTKSTAPTTASGPFRSARMLGSSTSALWVCSAIEVTVWVSAPEGQCRIVSTTVALAALSGLTQGRFVTSNTSGKSCVQTPRWAHTVGL